MAVLLKAKCEVSGWLAGWQMNQNGAGGQNPSSRAVYDKYNENDYQIYL
ncbi:MAG: hypothetical protein IT471_01345 [Pseudomonadales bacterium]|nr:hypothetical protein [Pseudomonadales bacterium]MCC6528893.1 hypothetical protein [Pseudomonadales bacterium]MCP5333666.1 hypothetical protein [Pseudomonadales bacterium]